MSSFQYDQAAGLRRIMAGPKPRLVSVLSASKKDEQAKIISNLAASLNRQGADVLVVHAGQDTDEAFRHYDLNNLPSLMDQAQGNFSNYNAIKTAAQGFAVSRLLPRLRNIRQYDAESVSSLNQLFSTLASTHEIVLVDTMLTNDYVLPLDVLNQSEIVIQMNQKPDSIKQAYSLIKILCQQLGRRPFGILIHDADERTAQMVFKNIAEVARRFMHIELEFMGFIPTDVHLGRAAKLGRSVIDAFPMASASQAFKQLALKLDYRQSATNHMQMI